MMWVVTVLFTLHSGQAEHFMPAMVANARQSLECESGCRQFDVCVSPADPHTVFLYELYDSEQAFALHLASAHFADFNRTTAPWVLSKIVQTFTRVAPTV